MRFATPLVSGRLIRRYMRFLSDVELDDGTVVKAHCPNPGSMMGSKDEGMRVWLEGNDDPKKKLDWGWRLAQVGDAFVGIDTGAANGVVAQALANGIDGLAAMVEQGHRAVLLFLVQRTDCTHVSVAADLDPTYAAAFASAMDAGVEVMCFDCTISPDGITLANRVPFDPPT